MRRALLPILLAASAAGTPAAAEQHSLVQVVCEPGARYFSVETVIVETDELRLGNLSNGNGLRTLRSLQDQPATCDVAGRRVETRVLRIYEPSERGRAAGIESGLIVVAVDGRQIAELNSTHRADPAPRGRVTVGAHSIGRCGVVRAQLIGEPDLGHEIIAEDCSEKLFQELGLAQ
jgi:hypothetical protein